MNNLSEIALVLREKDNFIIIPHKNPDGDCLGSSVALLLGLRDIGKTAYISLPNNPGERLSFLWDESYRAPEGFACDVCIAVDVAAGYMMDRLKEEIFDKAPFTVCLDHHGTNKGIADMNFIDASASAAGEVIYRLLLELKCIVSKDIASALYSAIASDTGSFRYSNTTSDTLKISAELVGLGIDSAKIMRILFETKSIAQTKIMSDIIDNMEFYFDNKVCITYCNEQMLSKYNLTFDDVDEYSTLPRTIKGVEVGVFLKCYSEHETKASLRSNEYADVSQVAASLGGGGHIRAAGVTINSDLVTAKQVLLGKLEELF